MARPRKCRMVCSLPESSAFAPIDLSTVSTLVKMSVDEFETIRLIDNENNTQAECALRMGVSRTTVQSIYDSARKKIAECLIEGKRLIIEGGDYKLCGKKHPGCHKNCEYKK